MRNVDMIVIHQEGLLPRFEKCGLFQCSDSSIGSKHKQSARCLKWTKEQTSKENNKALIEKTVFMISGIPIRNVDEFKYL
jgi:hypothetical protein